MQTYVLDYNDAVIRDAIIREMNRQGQVYFLYNQVRNIDQLRMNSAYRVNSACRCAGKRMAST